MYRAIPVSRQAASTSSRPTTRVVKRRLTTEAVPTPKKKPIVRRFIFATTLLTGGFYTGSAFVAYNNQTYYDFFSDKIPLGQSVLEYGQAHGWETLTVQDVVTAGTNVVVKTYNFAKDTINGIQNPEAAQKVDQDKKKSAEPVPQALPFKVLKKTTTTVEEEVKKVDKKVEKAVEKAAEAANKVAEKVVFEYSELVQRAEAAISGKAFDKPTPAIVEVIVTEEAPVTIDDSNVYNRPLPLGFEPPPGFARPPPPKPKASPESKPEEKVVELPLVAPAVSTASEPIISHLAGTIDNLASYLKSDPKAAEKAGDVLESAKTDLSALVDRIEAVRDQERTALEAKMDEQTREYTLKLLELEMEAQDKLDQQEDGYRKLFEQERNNLIGAYREKLNHELQVQTALINERLKEEVVAQGIELQRRWIREIKVRVEEERGGRLAKLDELSANLKRLERIALDNSAYLDENIRIHTLWTAIRAVDGVALSSNKRQPFRDELRKLRHVTAAREDPLASVVLDSLEESDVPDVGVEPFADLATWFVNEVAPKVSQVALVPDENAGVLSYLASRALSGLRFKRQGLVPGNDVLSVLARAEYYLNEKDLDSATRELNQLKGPAKSLLRDWLDCARKRLEVQQALEAVQTQATLASLLVV
ncbi:mitochondrial inner membrane protein Mitofilin [Panaeolus papilionaceus]|nr:mitochondrial inner membrane protein Mitofilin [Panaeolus papilionaceus]